MFGAATKGGPREAEELSRRSRFPWKEKGRRIAPAPFRSALVSELLGDLLLGELRARPGLGHRDGVAVGQAIRLEGLAAGETVVTDGHLRLVPGSHVSVKPAPGSTTRGAP